MRDAFFSELNSLFRHDRRVVFLTGDLGYKLFDQLKEFDPARVINCGIREAAMIGYAAGLAKSGLLPFVYSITPFVTLRCLEQIKIDLCYNTANVVVVGVGGGFAYGPNGPTHHGIDDVGALSCLPRLTLWTPCDPHEVRLCVRAAATLDRPAYLRLGRNKEPNIFASLKQTPDIAKPAVVREGRDGVIVTSGFILHTVLKAADALALQGIYPAVVRITTFRPFPAEYARLLTAQFGTVMTVEEHIANGGLGMEIARVVAESGDGRHFRMLTIPAEFPDACYDRDTLLARSGLDADAIATAYHGLFRTQETAKTDRDD
ncbi:MAG TPA: transketolase [Desulfuromonadales bacterium]|nr:transketolase [Desulfuromonadales bacterium]